jgi:hypothetical protein
VVAVVDRSRVASVALALMLLISSVAAPVAAQSNDAEDTTNGCTTVDGLLYDLFTFEPFSSNSGSDHPCSTRYQVDEAINETKSAEANQTMVDIYQTANADKAQEKLYLQEKENFVNQSASIAYSKGEAAAIDAIRANKSRSTAKTWFDKNATQYLAKQEMQMVLYWNVTAREGLTLQDVNEGEDYIYDGYVHYTGGQGYQQGNSTTFLDVDYTEKETLINGTLVNVLTPKIKEGGRAKWLNPYRYGDDLWDTGDDFSWQVNPPNSSVGNVTFGRASEYWRVIEGIRSTESEVHTNGDAFVDGMFDGLSNGTIDRGNLSQYASPTTLGQEYATNFNSTGYPVYALGSLGAAGVSVPDLNATGSMTVETANGTTYTGFVMSQVEPAGGWEANTTYDGTTMGGLQFILTENGTRVDLEEQFTITEIRNREGERIQSINVSKPSYEVADVSAYRERQALLEDFRAVLEEREPTAVGGIFDGYDSGTVVAVIVILGGAYVATRD